jgi:sec-independent protein translocase protein TatA
MLAGLESPMHLLVILVIALIVLGPKRLPEVGRGLGTAMRDFRQAIAGPDSADGRDPDRGDDRT